MNAHRTVLRRSSIAAAIVAAAAGLSFGADLQMIHSDGTVHRIGISPWTVPSGPSGTLIRHQIQDPTGAKRSLTVPGTDDTAFERSPVIGLDAADGTLVVAWIREADGVSVVRIARWTKEGWEAPVTLDGPSAGAGNPRLTVGASWIHVAWTEPSGGHALTPLRAVYRKGDFVRVYGPELLPTDGPIVGEDGATGIGDPPTSEGLKAFFGFVLPGSNPNDPGTLHVWGIRDEPVPIGYHQGMLLPVNGSDVRDLGAKNVGCTLLLWLQTFDRLIYRTYGGTGWDDFRVVNLDFQTSPEAARFQLEEMLRRR